MPQYAPVWRGSRKVVRGRKAHVEQTHSWPTYSCTAAEHGDDADKVASAEEQCSDEDDFGAHFDSVMASMAPAAHTYVQATAHVNFTTAAAAAAENHAAEEEEDTAAICENTLLLEAEQLHAEAQRVAKTAAALWKKAVKKRKVADKLESTRSATLAAKRVLRPR